MELLVNLYKQAPCDKQKIKLNYFSCFILRLSLEFLEKPCAISTGEAFSVFVQKFIQRTFANFSFLTRRETAYLEILLHQECQVGKKREPNIQKGKTARLDEKCHQSARDFVATHTISSFISYHFWKIHQNKTRLVIDKNSNVEECSRSIEMATSRILCRILNWIVFPANALSTRDYQIGDISASCPWNLINNSRFFAFSVDLINSWLFRKALLNYGLWIRHAGMSERERGWQLFCTTKLTVLFQRNLPHKAVASFKITRSPQKHLTVLMRRDRKQQMDQIRRCKRINASRPINILIN